MTARVRKFLRENGLDIAVGKVIGTPSTTFDRTDLILMKYVIENCSKAGDILNPVDWDTLDESVKDHWHELIRRIRGDSTFEQSRIGVERFYVRDPANGPIDTSHGLFLLEFTPGLIDDLIEELDRPDDDGLTPVEGFGA